MPRPDALIALAERREKAATREWIRAQDQCPSWGEEVEIKVFRTDMEPARAKWLGPGMDEGWWILGLVGGPVLMGVPSAPAYWRPIHACLRALAQQEGRDDA